MSNANQDRKKTISVRACCCHEGISRFPFFIPSANQTWPDLHVVCVFVYIYNRRMTASVHAQTSGCGSASWQTGGRVTLAQRQSAPSMKASHLWCRVTISYLYVRTYSYRRASIRTEK